MHSIGDVGKFRGHWRRSVRQVWWWTKHVQSISTGVWALTLSLKCCLGLASLLTLGRGGIRYVGQDFVCGTAQEHIGDTVVDC